TQVDDSPVLLPLASMCVVVVVVVVVELQAPAPTQTSFVAVSVFVMVWDPSGCVSVLTVVSMVVLSVFGCRLVQIWVPLNSPHSWPSTSVALTERQRWVPSGRVS